MYIRLIPPFYFMDFTVLIKLLVKRNLMQIYIGCMVDPLELELGYVKCCPKLNRYARNWVNTTIQYSNYNKYNFN